MTNTTASIEVPLQGHVKPCWSISDFATLSMTQDTLKSSSTPISTYTSVGHNIKNMSVYFAHECHDMPSIYSVREHFDFITNVGISINLLTPGTYLPWHVDGFDRYREIFAVKDVNQIFRALVMCQDSEPGQYVHIKDRMYHNWSAGDWVAWRGHTWHATYNLSTSDRYIVQITGTL